MSGGEVGGAGDEGRGRLGRRRKAERRGWEKALHNFLLDGSHTFPSAPFSSLSRDKKANWKVVLDRFATPGLDGDKRIVTGILDLPV